MVSCATSSRCCTSGPLNMDWLICKWACCLSDLSPKAPQLVPPGVADEKNMLAPSDYFRKNFYWTIETEEPEFAEAVQYLGADHFLFATDYPHDDPGGRMKHKDVELLAAHPKLSEGDKEKIRCANARQLFRLG